MLRDKRMTELYDLLNQDERKTFRKNTPEYRLGYENCVKSGYKETDEDYVLRTELHDVIRGNGLKSYCYFEGWERALIDLINEVAKPFLKELEALCAKHNAEISNDCCGVDLGIKCKDGVRRYTKI